MASSQIAVGSAARLGQLPALARCYRSLGSGLPRLGRCSEAQAALAQARGLYRRLGDRVGEARADSDISWVCELQGRYRDALRHAHSAMTAYQAAGYSKGEARAMNLIG